MTAGPVGVSSTPAAGVPLKSLCPCPGRMSLGCLDTLVGGGSRGSERGRSSAKEKPAETRTAGLEPSQL